MTKAIEIKVPGGYIAGTIQEDSVLPKNYYLGLMALFLAGWTLHFSEDIFEISNPAKDKDSEPKRRVSWRLRGPNDEDYGDRYFFEDDVFDNDPKQVEQLWTTMLLTIVETGFRLAKFPTRDFR